MNDILPKPTLRARAIAARRMFSADERMFATIAVAERGLPLLLATQGPIGLYHPFRDELDPGPLVERLAAAGRELALPCVLTRRDPLVFRRWTPGDPLVVGSLNIPEPPKTAEIVGPTVLIVPPVAFDARCYRIGYGAGFYDRTIPILRARHPVLTIGYAFAVQQVAHVPNEAHDVPLDRVVTDEAIFTGGNA